MQIARAVRECISHVEQVVNRPIDVMSLSYNRLMNHIRNMVARALQHEELKLNLNDYMEVKFPQAFQLAQTICDQVGKTCAAQSAMLKSDIWRCISNVSSTKTKTSRQSKPEIKHIMIYTKRGCEKTRLSFFASLFLLILYINCWNPTLKRRTSPTP